MSKNKRLLVLLTRAQQCHHALNAMRYRETRLPGGDYYLFFSLLARQTTQVMAKASWCGVPHALANLRSACSILLFRLFESGCLMPWSDMCVVSWIGHLHGSMVWHLQHE